MSVRSERSAGPRAIGARPTCPTDPGAKQDHLRALALLALVVHQHVPGLTAVPNDPEASSGSSFGESDSQSESDDASDSDADSSHARTHTSDLGEWGTFFRAGPSRLGRPEVVVVVDARQQTVAANRGSPVVDWGLPIEVPQRVLEVLFKRADAHPIIVANGIVLHAPAR